MIKKIMGLFLAFILLLSFMSIVLNDGDYDTEKERWTEVRYSTKIFADYPDYYPIEISFRSQGALPKDLQELHNYTGTIFISKYVITFNTSEIGDANKEIEKENEYVGREWKTITFDEFKDLGDNITAIEVNVTLFPHNSSLDISEDNYSFTITMSHEVEIENIGVWTSFIFIPLLIAPVLIWWQKYLNRIFLDNINSRNMILYTLKLPKNRLDSKWDQWLLRRKIRKKKKEAIKPYRSDKSSIFIRIRKRLSRKKGSDKHR